MKLKIATLAQSGMFVRWKRTRRYIHWHTMVGHLDIALHSQTHDFKMNGYAFMSFHNQYSVKQSI